MRAAEIVAQYVSDELDAVRLAEARRTHGVSFREVAHAYLDWLETMKGPKPTTLRSPRSLLAEPGTPDGRGRRTRAGYIMGALGIRPAMPPPRSSASHRHHFTYPEDLVFCNLPGRYEARLIGAAPPV